MLLLPQVSLMFICYFNFLLEQRIWRCHEEISHFTETISISRVLCYCYFLWGGKSLSQMHVHSHCVDILITLFDHVYLFKDSFDLTMYPC